MRDLQPKIAIVFHSASSTRAAAPAAAATGRHWMKGVVATTNGSVAGRRRNLSPFTVGPTVTTTGTTGAPAGIAGTAGNIAQTSRLGVRRRRCVGWKSSGLTEAMLPVATHGAEQRCFLAAKQRLWLLRSATTADFYSSTAATTADFYCYRPSRCARTPFFRDPDRPSLRSGRSPTPATVWQLMLAPPAQPPCLLFAEKANLA